ncbi:M48 family metalloprotease, partial [Candidatus Berkelbacteria bacterium]|nr:M48 family metalloprotease [Candidatus Berkelbacteria bacterium]
AAVRSAIERVGLNGGRYSVAVLGDRRPNAGAYPDGRIIVTSGMLDLVRSEDELAAVLAHERTHVDQRHSARQGKEFLLTALLTYGVARAVGVSGRDAVLAGQVVGTARWQRFSLRDEYRADEGSVKLLSQAGYQPDAMADLFERLKSQPPVRSENGEALCFLNVRTHPSFGARIEAVKRAANSQPLGLPTSGVDRRQITLFVEAINMEGYGYSSAGHVRQLILTELRQHVRVFETQTPEVRYKVILSANIVLGWSGGSRGVSLPEFDVQVSSGRSRAHGEFTGTVVDLRSAEVVGGVTTPRSGTSKTNSDFFVRAGRLSPIFVNNTSSGNMEQILLQRLVSEGVKSWVGALVKTVELRPEVTQPAESPTSFTNTGSTATIGQKGIVFQDLNGNGLHDSGEPIFARIKVSRIVGERVYVEVIGGRWPGEGYHAQLDQ